MRYFVPVVFLAAAGWVWFEATNGDDHYLSFPGVELVIEAARSDLMLRGKVSAGLLAAIGLVMLVRAARAGWAADG